MKKIALVLLASVIAITLKAQTHFEWAETFGGMASDVGNNVALDAAGNIYTIGNFSGTADFDPGAGVFNLTASGTQDVFITKIDASGNFIWAKDLGGAASNINGFGLEIDAAGNCYGSGYFTGTIDFDPATTTFNMTAVQPNLPFNPGDAYIVKLDAAGNFVWAKQLSGCLIYDWALHLDNTGNLYVGGSFSCMVDFDPGAGVFSMYVNSTEDGFILKLDPAGNFKWAVQTTGNPLNGSEDCRITSMTTDASGNVIATGFFIGDVDFSPGSGTFVMTNAPAATSYPPDEFIWKLDSLGNFLWAKQMGGPGFTQSNSISLDTSGNIITSGSFTDVMDFDPGPADFSLTANTNNTDMFISKLSSSGDFLWAKAIGGTGNDNTSSSSVDNQNNIYVTGSFNNNVDFDPGAGTNSLSSIGYDGFVLKFDSLGNFIYVRQLTGAGDQTMGVMKINSLGDIIATGSIWGQADFDPSAASFNISEVGGAGLSDGFVFKWSQDSCAGLTIVTDNITPVSCATLQGSLTVSGANGHPPYSYTWNTTPVSNTPAINVTSGGIYQATVTDDLGCTRMTDLLMNNIGYPSGYDLDINVANNVFRAGFITNVFLDAYNDGCIPQTGVLKLVLPGQVSLANSIPAPDLISGDTLMWSFVAQSYDSPHFVPQISLLTNQNAQLGDTICLAALITPVAGDADITNNLKTFCSQVIGSYDPNEKQVYPAGACEEGYVLSGTQLTYTVNFQNTGTAAAVNVHVIDSLDAALDINTLKIVGSSHPLITEVLPTHVIRFRFDGIELPDSNTNELASHGYVIYEASPLAGLASGTVVRNKAAIHFDYNAPIITNTVKNTLVASIPACVTEVPEINQRGFIRFYPNPASDVLNIEYSKAGSMVIMDMLGKVQQMIILSSERNKISVDIKNLVPGLYTYVFNTEEQHKESGKLVIIR